jgi:hypothetical protein
VIVFIYLAKILVHSVKTFFTTKWQLFGYFKTLKSKLQFGFFEVMPRKTLLLFFVIIAVLSITLYIYERQQWINSKALHVEAKEYFVTGQVLSTYRKIVTEVIKPDNLILAPLNGLQHLIYNSGASLLPKEDAEDALWYQIWFIYPYTQRDYIPYSDNPSYWDKQYPQHRWLENLWPYLEKLATHTIADPNMQIEYLKNYPGLAFYYALNQSFYFVKANNKMYSDNYNPLHYLITQNVHIERNRLMQISMQRYHEMYERQNMHNRFGKKHPKIEVLSIAARLTFDEVMIENAIINKQFRCDLFYLLDWVMYKNLFTGEKRDGVLYLLNKRELKHMHAAFVGSPREYFYKYVAQEMCGQRVYAMQAKEFQIPWGDKPWCEEDEYRIAKRWCGKELNLINQSLKGTTNGN